MVIKIPKIIPKTITDKYDVVSNSFVSKEKEFETEIGDVKQVDFFPQFKVKRWDNECNFSIRLVNSDLDVPKIVVEKDKIKYIKNKVEVHSYPIGELGKEGSEYEFEVILKEKPASNKLEFTIETKGLKFEYQPELTQEEINRGRSRPENVIGSYAVFHESKSGNYLGGQNYRAGKAFHIYRPKIIDSKGNWVWGELNINVAKKLQTVTIPQNFLDKAVYPIRHASGETIGYTSIGASLEAASADYKFGSLAAAVENGTALTISFYPKKGSYDDGPLRLAILEYVSGTTFKLIEQSAELSSPTYNSWNTYDLVTQTQTITNGEIYLIAQWGTEYSMAWDTSAGSTMFVSAAYTNGVSTWGSPGTEHTIDINGDSIYSHYVTYSAAGPSSSVSPSQSPSQSPSLSPSASVSPSLSPSSSQSPSSSVSPSLSPSLSPSSSVSPSDSPSLSPSSSVSPSTSPSPSAGYTEYTRGNYATLPTTDAPLETNYSSQDVTDVGLVNSVWVNQNATGEYKIHEFKDFAAGTNECLITCVCKTDLLPSTSTVYLQIYNRISSTWEPLASNNTASVDTNFTLTASVADLTNYKDGNTVVACRVYQLDI